MPFEERMMTENDNVYSIFTDALDQIAAFVYTPQFLSVLEELRAVPVNDRHLFVASVMLSEAELARRAVIVPRDLVIQRSVFADGRPTLFCVSKAIGGIPPWHKVTITFDNEGSMVGL
jgi:hypothetical protein